MQYFKVLCTPKFSYTLLSCNGFISVVLGIASKWGKLHLSFCTGRSLMLQEGLASSSCVASSLCQFIHKLRPRENGHLLFENISFRTIS